MKSNRKIQSFLLLSIAIVHICIVVLGSFHNHNISKSDSKDQTIVKVFQEEASLPAFNIDIPSISSVFCYSYSVNWSQKIIDHWVSIDLYSITLKILLTKISPTNAP